MRKSLGLVLWLALVSCNGDLGGTPVVAGQCGVVLDVNHKVSVPTVWKNTAAACDYLVNGTVGLSSFLKIEPGTVVQFSQDATFYVESGGQLEAVGTPAARIRFVGINDLKGYWNGLRFMSGSRESRIEHVDILNAGQTGSAPWKYGAGISGNGSITFNNNRVAGSYFNGASFTDDLNLLSFANNVFEDNLGVGLLVGYNQVRKLDKASDYVGKNKPNRRPYIYAAWGGTDDFTEDGTWPNLGVPYFISIALYVKAALTLEPGVQVLADDGTTIYVRAGGSLTAVGTPNQPITFSADRKLRGAWTGLSFFESSSKNNRLEHVKILYAGSGVAAVEANGAFRGSYLSINHTQIAQGAGLAVCSEDAFDTPTELVLGAGNDFQDNSAGQVGPCSN